MYNVTDIVFRQLIESYAPPDVFVTEFANVDGLQSSQGRAKILPLLYQNEASKVPLIGQIWGKNPRNFYLTAQELAKAGFAGIDLNMGCPEKSATAHNCCAALIKPVNRSLAGEIIQATREGAGSVPVSVKTRLGWSQTDPGWLEFLLKHKLDMLSIHARTAKELSQVPARHHEAAYACQLRDSWQLGTKIITNGDLKSKTDALAVIERYSFDGAMLGRAIFDNPFVFNEDLSWEGYPAQDRIELYLEHFDLFDSIYVDNERKFDPLKKFMKVYLKDFADAPKLRSAITLTNSCHQARELLRGYLKEKF